MFLSSKSVKLSKLTDASLPSAVFLKFGENVSPIIGLLGNFNEEIHVVPLEGEYQFEKIEANERLFQQRFHLVLPNIKFEYNFKSFYQTDSNENIEIGSLVRIGSDLQIVTKSINDKARPRVSLTLTNGLEDLGNEKVYFSDWSVFFKDELDWKKIWEKHTPQHQE